MIQADNNFYNSSRYSCSYLRLYKCASNSILKLLSTTNRSTKPEYNRVFTVLRNPYNRAASIHRQMIANNNCKLSFTEFLQDIANNGFSDKHQLPQTTLISNHNLQLFTLDNLEQVQKYIGSKKDIPIANRRRTQPDTFTNEQLELINHIYKEDLQLWESVGGGSNEVKCCSCDRCEGKPESESNILCYDCEVDLNGM